MFEIDRNLMILIGSLDHVVARVHRIVVKAEMNDAEDFTTVTVEVSDMKNHAPRFLSEFFQATVLETGDNGTEILDLLEFDPDCLSFDKLQYNKRSRSGGSG